MIKKIENFKKIVEATDPSEVIISEDVYKKLSDEEKGKYKREAGSYKSVQNISNEELSTYINLCMFEKLQENNSKFDELNEKIDVMKKIMIFWFIVTLISLISTIYIIFKI